MDNSITDITLIDCNSRYSEEAKGGNTKPLALFTNKVGSGIKVEAGDKISLYSAFVSELGAGSDAVEFSSSFLETRDIQYTQITGNHPINACNNKILGFESASATLVNASLENFGNKTSILINFYKTNNGENSFNLPRRYVFLSKAEHPKEVWVREDEVPYGKAFQQPCQIDTAFASNNGSELNSFVAEADYFYYQTPSSGAGQQTNVNGWKLKNDNSRFQIFVRRDTWYGTRSDPADNPAPQTTSYSPANWEYIDYIQKIDIELPVGFSSPTEVSEQITNTFQKQEEPQKIEVFSKSAYQSPGGFNASLQKYIPVSTKINSNMYKTFYSANAKNNNKDTYDAWDKWGGGGDENDALLYLSSFQYIGVKRPELFKKGRVFANMMAQARGYNLPTQGWFNFMFDLEEADFLKTNTGTAGREHMMVLNLAWDNTVLGMLRDIFLEQGNFPELFGNRYNQYKGFTTVDNSRFLHINVRNNDHNFFHTVLGFDNVLTSGSAINHSSCPVFFDYNPEYANTLTDGESWERGYAYGFAKKYIMPDGSEKIALTTRKMGMVDNSSLPATYTTMPNFLFKQNAGSTTSTKIKLNTNMGYDAHFNAFGNAFIGLNTGWCSEMYHEIEKLGAYPTLYYSKLSPQTTNASLRTDHFQQEIYLGADQPVCSFNTTTNRFEIAQLHTPEFIQNNFDAGGVNPTTTENIAYVPEVDTAGNRVYKINKRLNNSNFCPDMMSYSFNQQTLKIYGDVGKTLHEDYKVEFLNPNLEPWSIYDQLCGVIIKDFGYSEKTWNNGIWGVMGFEYSQFNAPRTQENDLNKRVGNNNKTALPFAFTNADIVAGDTINFPTNSFGAGMYNLQLPTTMMFNTDNGGAPLATGIFPANYPVQIQPAITSPQKSVVLSAPNLPRKLQNGYYLIRSNVLEDAGYHGGFESGALYPVISVVDKVNDTGDYYTQVDSTLEFTFTKPKVITEITTSVHNPSQALAEVNRDTAVIYKIVKQRPHTFNVIQEILNPPKK